MLHLTMTFEQVVHRFDVPDVLPMLAARHGYSPVDVLVTLEGSRSRRSPLYTVEAVRALIDHGIRSGDLPADLKDRFENALIWFLPETNAKRTAEPVSK